MPAKAKAIMTAASEGAGLKNGIVIGSPTIMAAEAVVNIGNVTTMIAERDPAPAAAEDQAGAVAVGAKRKSGGKTARTMIVTARDLEQQGPVPAALGRMDQAKVGLARADPGPAVPEPVDRALVAPLDQAGAVVAGAKRKNGGKIATKTTMVPVAADPEPVGLVQAAPVVLELEDQAPVVLPALEVQEQVDLVHAGPAPVALEPMGPAQMVLAPMGPGLLALGRVAPAVAMAEAAEMEGVATNPLLLLKSVATASPA
ncbi:hypothetical protein RSK20926_05202 [Roseobacter sp. SK209-2-6]|nr:hypothetical protein RSK20926_05202 [Roseobacter sp. SK209-2-6]